MMRPILRCVAMLSIVSCTPPLPPPIPLSTHASRVEWLLGHGALLNAVDIHETGMGAAVGDLGAILVTKDGGVSWKAAESGTSVSLRAVAFSDHARAVIAGDGGTVLRSVNGGAAWSVVNTGMSVQLRGVALGSPDVGVIVGEGGTVLRTDDGGATWVRVSAPTAAALRAVSMSSPETAIAVGDGGTIIRSSDGGRTWTNVPSGTRVSVRAVHFVTPSIAVAVGGDDSYWRARGIALRSEDAGATWSRVSLPRAHRLYAVTSTEATLLSLGEGGTAFSSSDAGRSWREAEFLKFASGQLETGNWFAGATRAGRAVVAVTYAGSIVRSDDSGTTWKPSQESPVAGGGTPVTQTADGALVVGVGNFILRAERGASFEKTLTAVDQRVMRIVFVDSLTGVAVGWRGAIQRTVDGGRTWTRVESGTPRYLWNLAFADSLRGVAAAGYFRRVSGRGMLFTEDGGVTWQPRPCEVCDNWGLAGLALHPSGVGFAFSGAGIVVRTTNSGRDWLRLPQTPAREVMMSVTLLNARTAVAVGGGGAIVHTSDSGATWTRRESGTPLTLNDVAFADAARGVIVGAGGTILTTSDGGLTWRREPGRTTRLLWNVIVDDSGDAIITGERGLVLRYTWGGESTSPTRSRTGAGHD